MIQQGGIFEVVAIQRTLPEYIQVNAMYQDKDEILRTRCFFIGKVQEFVCDPHERKLQTFLAPVELVDGNFIYSGEASNFIDFEITYTNKNQKKQETTNETL